MVQKKIQHEMKEIMEQLPLNCQRYLVELARAAQKAESYLSEPAAVSASTGKTPAAPHDPRAL